MFLLANSRTIMKLNGPSIRVCSTFIYLTYLILTNMESCGHIGDNVSDVQYPGNPGFAPRPR